MRWFRYFTEALHDPKVQRLPPPLFRHWINILCIANNGKPRGRLPDMKAIAYDLRVPVGRAEQIMRELQERGLIDNSEGRLVPHNWDRRQPQSDNAPERMQNIRRTSSEHVRPQTQIQNTDNRTRSRTPLPPGTGTDPVPVPTKEEDTNCRTT